MQPHDYLRKFQGHDLPDAFEPFVHFVLEQPDACIADGFYLRADDGKVMYETYSKEPEFTSSFLSIGSADGKGSEYSFWLQGGQSLKEAPVVVFGGEGGIQVVASSFAELLRILSFDVESSVDWGWVEYTKDGPSRPSPRASAFHGWLQAQLGVGPLQGEDEVSGIVKQAEARYGAELKAWVGRFFQE